jgi:hypothetical protein
MCCNGCTFASLDSSSLVARDCKKQPEHFSMWGAGRDVDLTSNHMIARPCLITACAAQNMRAICQCPLQHFMKHELVHVTPSAGCNCAHLQQADAGGCLRQQHEVDAARQRGAPRAAVAAASAAFCCRQQAPRRQVRRHQGAGARGVRADAGALGRTERQHSLRGVFIVECGTYFTIA